jgi:hypothetical protein
MMTPQQLQQRVVEALWSDDELDARHIRVAMQGHDIWLEGDVPTPAMYDRAEHIASTVVGVEVLTNNLSTSDGPYDFVHDLDGESLRESPSTDVTPDGRMEARMDIFGEEWDDTSPLEGNEQGGPVGGDSGAPTHPTDLNESAPLAIDIIHAESPWRYQTDGPNTDQDVEAVLPPDDDEV